MIKWLIVIALVWLAWTFWRNGRIADARERERRGRAGGTQEMVSCAVCSVHVPRSDAVAGADGRLYCSQEHRLAAERGT